MKKRVPQLDTTGFKFAKNPKVKRGKRTPSPDADKPQVPIELEWDELLKHMRWRVVDSEAWDEIRLAVFARCGGKCEGCGANVYYSTLHLHHWRGRGKGERCDCPDHLQALCPDQFLEDNTTRHGCHTLVHKGGNLRERFARGAEAVSE